MALKQRSGGSVFRLIVYFAPMTVIESIVHDLRGMPLGKLVEVARYVHRLSETAERERAEVLAETHGYLDENDGLAFEQALETSRRIEARG